MSISARLVSRKATEDNATSYILKEMIPAYRSAASESGQFSPILAIILLVVKQDMENY